MRQQFQPQTQLKVRDNSTGVAVATGVPALIILVGSRVQAVGTVVDNINTFLGKFVHLHRIDVFALLLLAITLLLIARDVRTIGGMVYPGAHLLDSLKTLAAILCGFGGVMLLIVSFTGGILSVELGVLYVLAWPLGLIAFGFLVTNRP